MGTPERTPHGGSTEKIEIGSIPKGGERFAPDPTAYEPRTEPPDSRPTERNKLCCLIPASPRP